MTISHDPFEVAVQAAEQGKYFYGTMQVSANFVTLRKGEGKKSFVEGVDELKDRRTDIGLVLIPIDEMGMTRLVERTVIAESAEWRRIVWPSLHDGCGLKSLKELDGKFVKIELAKNGRSWNDKTSGEMKEGTTFKFLAIYADQAACVASFYADGNQARSNDDGNPQEVAAASIDMDTPTTPAPAADDSGRAAALEFLPIFVKQANGNVEALAQTLKATPFVAKYFDINSPEVVKLLAA